MKTTRKLTTTINLIAHGLRDVRGWKTIATLVKRGQIHDRRQFNCCWENYPSNRFGWVAFSPENGCRFIGVGVQPIKPMALDEHLVRVPLPFTGSGRDMRELVSKRLVHNVRGRVA